MALLPAVMRAISYVRWNVAVDIDRRLRIVVHVERLSRDRKPFRQTLYIEGEFHSVRPPSGFESLINARHRGTATFALFRSRDVIVTLASCW